MTKDCENKLEEYRSELRELCDEFRILIKDYESELMRVYKERVLERSVYQLRDFASCNEFIGIGEIRSEAMKRTKILEKLRPKLTRLNLILSELEESEEEPER